MVFPQANKIVGDTGLDIPGMRWEGGAGGPPLRLP